MLTDCIQQLKSMGHGVILPGKPYPRGATRDSNGLNVSVFSENAERIALLLYDSVEERVFHGIDHTLQIGFNMALLSAWQVAAGGTTATKRKMEKSTGKNLFR